MTEIEEAITDLLKGAIEIDKKGVSFRAYLPQEILDKLKELGYKSPEEVEELVKQEREKVLKALFEDSDIYPYHLLVWAKTIKDKQKYDSTLSATLRSIGHNWQALKEESNETDK